MVEQRFLSRRLSRRRALQAAALGSAGLATAVAAACGGKEGKEVVPAPTTGPEGEPGRPVLGGTTRGTGGGIPGLDPLITGFFLTQVYASYPYSRIVRYKTVTGKLDPSSTTPWCPTWP